MSVPRIGRPGALTESSRFRRVDDPIRRALAPRTAASGLSSIEALAAAFVDLEPTPNALAAIATRVRRRFALVKHPGDDGLAEDLDALQDRALELYYDLARLKDAMRRP